MQKHHQREHHIRAEAIELAVGEVHHPHDAEDERQSNAQQRVDAAEHKGVHTMLEKFVHAGATQSRELIELVAGESTRIPWGSHGFAARDLDLASLANTGLTSARPLLLLDDLSAVNLHQINAGYALAA